MACLHLLAGPVTFQQVSVAIGRKPDEVSLFALMRARVICGACCAWNGIWRAPVFCGACCVSVGTVWTSQWLTQDVTKRFTAFYNPHTNKYLYLVYSFPSLAERSPLSRIDTCTRTWHPWAVTAGAYQGNNTNNYAEAWHKTLKTKFSTSSERRRIDELTQVFCDIVDPYFRRQFSLVNTGFAKQRANKVQQRAKDRAKGFTPAYLAQIGARVHKLRDHLQSYRVDSQPPSGFAEGRVVTCNCHYFTRCGSACKHMYYLAHEYKFLVVKSAPDTNQPNAIMVLDSDSDVEVLNCLTKGSNSGLFSPRDTPDPKRTCLSRLAPTAFADAHPNLQPATSRPSTSTPAETTNTTTPSRAVLETTQSNIQQLECGSKALKCALEALKKKKDRVQMVEILSASGMNQFQGVCHSLLRLVEERVPGISHTTTPSFMGVDNTGRMSGLELGVLIGDLQVAGLGALKRMQGLLRGVQNSKNFVANSTDVSMDLFKERCYEIVGILKETLVLAARVQVR
ncbi:hypothetical protein PTTG_26746 [Puccinia triticina 1-1 BBBD Race 1]|uniref:SWIM-type domain-containing protein n=1 Tax=Puccinia triticina (isolate 1-1 / race 1 (BBBD)) TaxID=630390 RepID=A0A180GRQ8_PUCT1|nr:hypothetical protein PTTG_26746 [Puccinia triticina 1-1 BBBD Race 1]